MQETHGGRKNCSRTTYIPRIISARRKYLLALSSELSPLSSHRRVGGKRKPEGGGPAGVAALWVDDENAAVAVRDKIVRLGTPTVENAETVRLRDINVRDLAHAMAMKTCDKQRRRKEKEMSKVQICGKSVIV